MSSEVVKSERGIDIILSDSHT